MEGESNVGDVLGLGQLPVKPGLLYAELRLYEFRTLCQRCLPGDFQIRFFQRLRRHSLGSEVDGKITRKQVVEVFLAGLKLILQLNDLILRLRELGLNVEGVRLQYRLLIEVLKGNSLSLLVLLYAGLCGIERLFALHDSVISLLDVVNQRLALGAVLLACLIRTQFLLADCEIDLVKAS